MKEEIANIISSTKRKLNGKANGKVATALFSRSCRTISAMISDNGEPIGVPKIC